jgi:myo-inositol-1(or 4)-monophosphatase
MDNAYQFAVDIAQQIGDFLLESFNLFGTKAELKADRSLVTEIDLAADRMFAESLHSKFPDDDIISEELRPVSSDKIRTSWIIDPLDGTTNFSLGLPFWGVSIARLVDGIPDIAALYFPPVREFYTAQAGQGAFLNDQPIQVRPLEKDRPAAFFACCSRSYRRYQIDIRFKPRILGSAAYNLCAVARGLAVLGFEATAKVWDLAGGWLVIKEAGGLCLPLDGLSPFPIRPNTDFRAIEFPTVSAATPDLVELARRQIRPRQAV